MLNLVENYDNKLSKLKVVAGPIVLDGQNCYDRYASEYTGKGWTGAPIAIIQDGTSRAFDYPSKIPAQSLGNHEFDNGVRGLTPFIEHLTCPILAANLVLDNVPELAQQTNLKKSIVFNLSGTKVGIIGYLTPETKVLAIKNDVEYTDEIVAIKEEVTILQNAGVKIIIALGHSGYIVDKKIAQEVEGLDLVIGGHSHTFLWEGPNPDTEDAEGSYPTYITQSSGKIVPVVQAYAFTKYFGKIHLFFNSDGEMISSDGRPIILDKTIPEDPQILTILERYQREVQSISNEVVGNTSVVLDGRSCEKRECNLGNLIVDSVVYTYAKKYKGEHWTDAPIAIIQAGGIRSSIARTEMPTEITKGDLLTVMPFKGHLVTVAMNGSVLIKMLEHSIARYEIPKVGEFLQISGLKVVYDINKPVGSRVVKAVARCWACNIPEYSKVDNKQIYKVLMPKFVAMGGDGYSMLKNLPSTTLSFSELLSTQYYVRQHSPVFPEVEGRIVIHDKHEESSSIIISSSLSLTILSIIITFT